MVSSRPAAVAVYCASSLGKQKAFESAAVSVGTALARAERPVVYGGGSRGIMGVVSGAAMEAGGSVVGVMPYAMYSAGGEREKTTTEIMGGSDITIHAHGNERVTTIVVNSMHERKVEMAKRAGAFVALPGGFGTYEEVLEAITWTQLGIQEKPIVILNVLSFYSPLKELIHNGVREGFIQSSNERLAVFVDGPTDLSQHETFDWGDAALKAIDSWTRETTVFAYDWGKQMSAGGEKDGSNLDNV